jgi:hypothetical protein
MANHFQIADIAGYRPYLGLDFKTIVEALDIHLGVHLPISQIPMKRFAKHLRAHVKEFAP